MRRAGQGVVGTRVGGLLAVLAVVASLAGAAAHTADAAFPGANGKIAWHGGGIWIANANGSAQRQLTTNANDSFPTWSPDGTKIAFQRFQSGTFQAWVMDADGSGQTQVTNDPSGALRPAWSPNGLRLAFVSTRDRNQAAPANTEIYSIALDGSSERRLTNDPAPDDMPAWSPDGQRIAFDRTLLVDDIPNMDVWVMDADGSNPMRLTTAAEGDSAADWSPDGSKLVFRSHRDRVGGLLRLAIWVMNPDGTGQTRLTDPADDFNTPVWSPQGTKILFLAGDGFRTMNPDGTGQAPLAPTPFGGAFPDWQPLVDTDGDALPDEWETNALDIDGDGTVDLDLPAMGADPNHKDIFVELDSMAGHELDQAAIDVVIASFAAAPVVNPDGATGIRLHVDNGPNSPMDHTGGTWGTLSDADTLAHDAVLGAPTPPDNYDWTEFDALKSANFQPARARAFHYAIAAHQYESGANTSSGIARDIPSADFIVSLGAFCPPPIAECSGTVAEQAGTFMHELGHNLGLGHGGQDHLHRKPNYFSVMNYKFQFSGLVSVLGTTGLFDYSGFGAASIATLDENALNEATGFGATVPASLPYYTTYRCPDGTFRTVRPADNLQVDWNCDNSFGGSFAVDISGKNGLGVLTPYADWPRLIYKGGAIGSAGAAPTPPASTPLIEPPVAEIRELGELLTGGGGSGGGDAVAPVTAASASPAANAAGWNRDTVTVELSATDDGSGVEELVYSTGGAQTTVPGGSATVEIAAEGITTLTFFARDAAGNEEGPQTLVVRIDRTAPTAKLRWNPATLDFRVVGADSLSGVAGVALEVTPEKKHGERRRYVVSDVAGNARVLHALVREHGKDRLVTQVGGAELDVHWTQDKDGALRRFRQHAKAGARHVDADWDEKRNVTKITDRVGGEKKQHLERAGVVLLDLVIEGGDVSIAY